MNSRALPLRAMMIVSFLIAAFPCVCAGEADQCGLFRDDSAVVVTVPALQREASSVPFLFAQRVIEEKKEEEKKPKEDRLKSPPKAFLMSALIPGAGELYAHKKRGFLFLGFEVASWAAYYSYHASGKDKEDEYMRFADEHYDTDKLGDQDGCNKVSEAARLDSLKVVDPQHYYEDVGKYDKFLCGWEDTDTLSTYSAYRATYRTMRDKSNDLLRTARYFTMLALLNHVVSSIDAIKVTRAYNEKLARKTGFRLEYEIAPDRVGVGVVYRFS